MNASSVSGYQDLRAVAGKAQQAMRLDQALAELLPLSRRRSRRAIDEGGVYLNRKRCRTAGRTLKNGDSVRVVLLDGEKLIPFHSDQIIWQQPPLYLIHKQSGQYAQEALHRSRGTLPDELARHLKLTPSQAADLRPVHRLDRGTSGLMLFSANPTQLQLLQKIGTAALQNPTWPLSNQPRHGIHSTLRWPSINSAINAVASIFPNRDAPVRRMQKSLNGVEIAP